MVRFYYFLFRRFSFTLCTISQNSSHNNRLLSIAKTAHDWVFWFVKGSSFKIWNEWFVVLYCNGLQVFMHWIQYWRCLISIGLNVDSHNRCGSFDHWQVVVEHTNFNDWTFAKSVREIDGWIDGWHERQYAYARTHTFEFDHDCL